MSNSPARTYSILHRPASDHCGFNMYASFETQPESARPTCVLLSPEDAFKTNNRREAEREIGRLVSVMPDTLGGRLEVVALRDPDTLKATQ